MKHLIWKLVLKVSAISLQWLECARGDRIQESTFGRRCSLFTLASRLNRYVVVAVICHFYAFSRLPRVLNWDVGADSVVSFQPLHLFGMFLRHCAKKPDQITGTGNATRKQRWRIFGKPCFSLAGVTNERINVGHAQREWEPSMLYAGCLDEYSGFVV